LTFLGVNGKKVFLKEFRIQQVGAMGDKKLLYVSLFILVLGLSEVQVFGSDHEKSDNSKEKNKVMNFHVT
jgi:hypothetical protein